MNKVYSLLAAAFCLVAFSCAKQEIDNPASVGKTTRVKVKASIELPAGMTKSTISGSSFLWSEYDQIACYTTTGSFQNSDPLESEDITGAGQSARFWFSLTGTNPYLKDVAVFPVFPDKKPTYDTSTETLTIKIPDTIAWVDGEVDNIEVAYFGGSSLTQNINLNFVNVAGVIKFTLNNLPVGANQVFFKTGKTITGDFVIENLSTKWTTWTEKQYENLYISAGADSDSDGITFTFDQVTEAGTSKVFYVPVPTGTYSQIGFKVQNNDGQTVTNLWKKTATVSNTVGRGTMLVMPALTFASATGGGEGNPTNIITTLSGQTGAVALPSTTESVLVEMNTTAGALDLEYADGGEKPANVYVKVLTDATVNTLNIDLPNSTVYVNGLDNSNVGTLSSVTAESTLKVLASPLTIGKATINQGNVEIGGTVNSVVVAEGATSDGKSAGAANQVRIFVTKEAALQTITLNAKTDVVVEQPKDNIDAAATENKVYVIVNAVGSSATAQNGGDIYVTANANCSVTANGDDATVVLENNGATVTETETAGGDIETGVVYKAKIGNVEYETLAAAITAANANDEIVILVDQTVKRGYTIDKDLTINLNGKTLTANAVSDSDSNFTNNSNRLFHVEGSDIDFTINNGTIVLDEHIWGTVRFISQGGNLALTDVTTYNFREYGANIKLSYGHAAFNNVIMHSDKGGCVDIGDGASESAPSGATAVMTNCIFDQTNEGSTDNNKTVSAAIITSYSGHVILNSGTYSAYYALFPHSSGGTITVKDGCTITGRHNAVHTTKHGHTSTQEDHCIYIQGGTINGAFDVATDGHTTFSVTGGTFDHDPSAYVADGYVATQSGNVWTVAPISGVAAIGTQGYETLTAAFAAVNNNETITMLADVNLTDRIFVNAGATPTLDSGNRYATSTESKTITLDLNGHNITSTSNFAQAGGTFNITNTGTADDTHGVISTTTAGLAPVEVRGTGDLTAKRTLNVGAGVTLTGTTYGINVFGSNTDALNKIEVNVNGTVNGTIFVLGNLKNTDNEISINVKGKVYVAANDDDKRTVGVALNGYASVNVASTANVEGETGIEVRAGQLTVANGATIKANSSFSYEANGSGSTTTGAAIAVVQHTTGLPIIATINGGTLTGAKKLYVRDEMGNYLDNVAVSAVGAIKNEAEIPAGFVWQVNGNMFYLVPFFAAQIGETKYATLAAAVTDATNGQTVTILQAGNYDIPAITKTLTIEAAVSGVVVNNIFDIDDTDTAIADIATGKTATFKNITFNLGDLQRARRHGFGTSASSGALVMDGCTVNGALHLFGVSTFTNCTFAVSGQTKYNIWAIDNNASFTNCSFTNTDRAVNVYDHLHGSTIKNVSFTNCSFTGNTAKKAAINVHHNPDGTPAKFTVSINNCTTTGTWASTPEAKEAATTVCYSTLWMISDIKDWTAGDITVSVNGTPVTTWDGSAKAALTAVDANTYAIYTAPQLAQFAYEVNNNDNNFAGKTVKLMNNIDLNNNAWTPIGLGGSSSTDDLGSETGCFLGTFDGQDKTISNLTATHINGDRSFAALFGNITLTTAKNVVIKNVNVTNVNINSKHMAAGILARTQCNAGSITIDHCSVTGGTITSTPFENGSVMESGNQAAGIIGLAQGNNAAGINITNNTVSGITVTATRDLGGLIGCLKLGGTVTGNSVSNSTVKQEYPDNYESGKVMTTVNAIIGRTYDSGGTVTDNTDTNVTVTLQK